MSGINESTTNKEQKMNRIKKIASELNDLQRSRLKLTIAGMAVIVLVLLVPIFIIFKASSINLYEINAPWIFLGTSITAFATLAGYYINKESIRPSLLTTNIFDGVKKILPGEDESDPENIPL